MDQDILDGWNAIISQDKMKLISNKLFDNSINLDFPNIENNIYSYKKVTILSKLESIGNILIEFEKNGLLTHNEVLSMIEIVARELLNKAIPSTLLENVSLMLDKDDVLHELREDEWLDTELKHIEQVLDSLEPVKKRYE